MECITRKATTWQAGRNRHGLFNHQIKWTTLERAPNRRARRNNSNGPQQDKKICHGHNHHSFMRVAVETRMEGVVVGESPVPLLLEEAGRSDAPPEEVVKRHSEV